MYIYTHTYTHTYTYRCMHLYNYFLKNLLFLAALGFHCCMRAFSGCGKQGLLSSCGMWASHCSGFSCCRAWAPEDVWASVVVAVRLSCCVSCGIFWDQGSNPCIGMCILNHWTTREVLPSEFDGQGK